MGVRLLWWFPYPISQMENDRDKVKAFEKIISNSEEDRRDFELQLRGKDDIIKRLDQELQNISIENSQRSIEYNQLAQEMKLQQEMPGPVFEDGESLSGVAELQFMGKLEQLQVMPPLHRMAIFVPPVCDHKICQVVVGGSKEAEWLPRSFKGGTQEVQTSPWTPWSP